MNEFSIWIVIKKWFVKLTETGKKMMNRFGQVFDALFADNRFLLLFSFLGAVTLFVGVNFSWFFTSNGNQGEVIANVPVIQIYDKDNYVVEGLPAFADITLFGDATDIEVVKSLKQYQVEIDLTGLGIGEHVTELRVKNIETGVTTSTAPQQVNITITPKVTEQAAVTYELVNEAKLNQEYTMRNVKLSQDMVTLKASQVNLERVASVQALVDVTNLQLGTFSGKAQLVAFDDRGNKLDIAMEPSSVSVSAEVVEYSRILPVEPIFSGPLPENKAVKNYRFSKNSILVYGPRNVLNTLTSIRIPLNYINLPEAQEVSVQVPLPAGVKKVDPTQLNITVGYGDLTKKTFESIPIVIQNLAEEYQVQETTLVAEAEVWGSKELLELLTKEQLKVTIDLQGLTAGTHEIEVKISGPTYFNYELKTKTITIVIEEK
ncbi:MAG: CdaR family protein [Culicoidibacterales bacterium]